MKNLYMLEEASVKCYDPDGPSTLLVKTDRVLTERELWKLIKNHEKPLPIRFNIFIRAESDGPIQNEKTVLRTYSFGKVVPFDKSKMIGKPIYKEIMKYDFCVAIDVDGRPYQRILYDNDIVLDENLNQIWPPVKTGFLNSVANYFNGFKKVR